jgi:iron complex transport system permease protein
VGSLIEPALPAGPSISSPGLPRYGRRLLLLLLAAGLLLAVSPLFGDVRVAAVTVFGILLHQVSLGVLPGSACPGVAIPTSRCSVLTQIVWDARVPELLLAVLVGAALGLSGATLQGVFRNPLADPYLLGLSSGAAFGAAVLFEFRLGLAQAQVTLPLFAFLGSLASGVIVLLAARSPRSTVTSLLLTGVALSAFFSALLVVALLYNLNGSLQVSYWLLGGLFGASWTRDGLVFGGVVVAGALLVPFGRELNLLQLGPDVAQSLGVNAPRARWSLILLTSILTSFAVAFAGVIGFVGLVAPHVARRLFTVDYRWVLPVSAVVGAIFVLGARDLALLAFPGTEVPVGVPMAFGGALFFIYLLYRRRGPEDPEAHA